MRIKFVILLLLVLSIVAAASFYLYWEFVFFPGETELKEEKISKRLVTNGSQVISHSLLNRLNEADFRGDFSKKRIKRIVKQLEKSGHMLKRDPYAENLRSYLCYNVGSGKPGACLDARSSILMPHKTSISFYVRLRDLPCLEFSAIPFLSEGTLTIDINSSRGKKISKSYNLKTYLPEVSGKDANHPAANINCMNAGDSYFWKDYKINLPEMSRSGARIRFSFNGKNGMLFLANPRIYRQSNKSRLNIIYIALDGIATRHLGIYNKDSELTPFLKQKSDGDFIVFNNMFSLGNMSSIAETGFHMSTLPCKPGEKAITNSAFEIKKLNRQIRRGNISSLPDVFSKRGYITERIENTLNSADFKNIIDYGYNRTYEYSNMPGFTGGISNAFLKFIRKNRGREFFIYLNYSPVGEHYYASIQNYIKGLNSAPFESLWRPLLAGYVNYVDGMIKEIYTALEDNNLVENSIIIIATSYGAKYSFWNYESGEQHNDYTRMAYMMRLPGQLRKELGIDTHSIDSFISSINIAPTLVNLCSMNSVSAFKGRSYKDILRKKPRKKVFNNEVWCFGKNTASLITGNVFKYIQTYMKTDESSKLDKLHEELYNLKDDPYEMHNKANVEKKVLNRLRNIFIKRDISHSITSRFAPAGN